MRKVIGCLVLLAASPAFGYLVDIRGAGDSGRDIYLLSFPHGGPVFGTIEMYIDTESTMITATSAESRIATVDSSGNPVPDVLDIIGPDAIPKTYTNGSLKYYTYPQYSNPPWNNRSDQLGSLPLPQGRVNFDQSVPSAHADHNWSTGRIGSMVNAWNGHAYIYGRVLLATFTVKAKDGYSGPYGYPPYPSFYVVAADAYVYTPAGGGRAIANPGQKIAVYVDFPEPATALLMLGAIPFLRRRRR